MPIRHDRHVLATAVRSGAQIIVTSNLRHFPAAALDELGVAAQSPDEFLIDLLDQAPTIMAEIVRQQAAILVNPPKTPMEMADTLSVHAPRFASAIRELL